MVMAPEELATDELLGKRPVLRSGGCKDVEIAQDLYPVDCDIEHPLPRGGPSQLREVQSHREGLCQK